MTMHKALHLSDDVDRLYELRKEKGRGLASFEKKHRGIDTTARRLHRKTRTWTDDRHQKRYKQHERRQNNNLERKMGEKTTL